MKVVYTDEALQDLDAILAYLAQNYPTLANALERRLRLVMLRIGAWPQSAQEVAERPGVRVVPLVRYPYKIFYRVTTEAVEILHIRHVARRQPWDEQP